MSNAGWGDLDSPFSVYDIEGWRMWEWEPSNDVLSEWSSAMSLQLGQAVFSRTLRLSTSRLIYVLLCTEEVAFTSKKKNVAILESVRLSVTVCSSAILLTFFLFFWLTHLFSIL